ncbi:MAG: ATP-binding cassette domain-containing protein [Cytophagales bacterium]|nr:ATP-binding cassette domain-containing protein [Bernardetiaceae bacterium]MDW8203828.1 ATP-binding cassette domain-containing protein [Cytophagales bacterium]
MNSAQFVPIIKRLSVLTGHGDKLFNFSDLYGNAVDCGEDIDKFIELLGDKSEQIELAMLRNVLPKTKISALLQLSEVPVLFFIQQNGKWQPLIIYKNKQDFFEGYTYQPDGTELYIEEISDLQSYTYGTDKHGNIIYIIPFPRTSLLSEREKSYHHAHHLSPMQRMFRLLKIEQRDIWYVYFYAVIIAAISLTLPLGIQAIMELVSGGVIFSSIVLIIAFVIVGVLASGVLQILQYHIVEVIQRRIFVKAAFEFSYRIPNVRTEAVTQYYTPELMNRFFDILTIQKSLPKILIDLASSVLQIIFGIILLSFYHPAFLVFGLALAGILTAIFYFTGPEGLRTSIIESKYKYKVVHWLEELARSLEAFKLAGHTTLPLSKTENLVNNYLYYRKKHFKVLMTQFGNIVGFKTIVTGGLLIIGVSLVINRQILIGQFVASEIVIILILAAVEKVILSMSTIYDMLTATDKVGHVTDLPIERQTGIAIPRTPNVGLSIRIKNLTYQYPDGHKPVLNGVNLDIAAGERVCLSGFNSSGKDTLVRILSGILDNYEGLVAFNNISLRDINLNTLRDMVASNFAIDNIFEGTILDNITMGKSSISLDDAVWALEKVGLSDFINELPNGLQTELIAGGKSWPSSIHVRLTLARCIAERPQLLILNDFFSVLQKNEKRKLLDFLVDRSNPWTLLLISNDPVLMQVCDRNIILKDGKVHLQGSFQELNQHPDYYQVVLSC